MFLIVLYRVSWVETVRPRAEMCAGEGRIGLVLRRKADGDRILIAASVSIIVIR